MVIDDIRIEYNEKREEVDVLVEYNGQEYCIASLSTEKEPSFHNGDYESSDYYYWYDLGYEIAHEQGYDFLN